LPVVTMALVLLVAVVVSAFVVRLLPISIPAPLLQITVGALLSYAFGFEIAFDPHLFLLLFIPPLLFLDGWRIPKGAFFRDRRAILTLAIGLVIFTVIGVGWFVHWLLPVMPIAVAFALAAILSPTDPVAVGAMTATTPLPSRLMHILEGEALLNDATGLVCFTFAVKAALTGKFSATSASFSFLLVAGGGVACGIGVMWIIGKLNRALIKRTGEEPSMQILISLLMPFAAYLTAEHLHVSGILAAAVAGIAMHYGELAGKPLAATRMQRTAVWDTVQATLNGIIFILLGGQIPQMLRKLPAVSDSVGAGAPWHLAFDVAAITFSLIVMRFLWVFITMHVTVLRANLRGEQRKVPSTRLIAVVATAGVRGAITLAGVLTLPMAMADGSAFPARDVAIVLAMGVIVMSLLLTSIGLPLIARGLVTNLPQQDHKSGEGHARIAASEAAIRKLEQTLAQTPSDPDEATAKAEAGMHVLDAYRRRLEYGDVDKADSAALRRVVEVERTLRREAIVAEREELYRLRQARSIDDGVHQRLMRELDLIEASLTPAAGH
jgi:Na+/H+ antiporter